MSRRKLRHPPDPWRDRILWDVALDHSNGTWRGSLSGVRWTLELSSNGILRGGEEAAGIAKAHAAGGGYAQFSVHRGGIRAAHKVARDVIRTAVAQTLSFPRVSDYD